MELLKKNSALIGNFFLQIGKKVIQIALGMGPYFGPLRHPKKIPAPDPVGGRHNKVNINQYMLNGMYFSLCFCPRPLVFEFGGLTISPQKCRYIFVWDEKKAYQFMLNGLYFSFSCLYVGFSARNNNNVRVRSLVG